MSVGEVAPERASTGWVTDEELLAAFEQCKNWGRWGSDDRLGTLNLITAEKRREAAALVKTGASVSISRPIAKGPGEGNLPRVDHHMIFYPGAPGTYDYVGISCHGPDLTHLDALGHSIWEGITYNGQELDTQLSGTRDYMDPAPGNISFDGIQVGDIAGYKDGIFTRGVFLDVAGATGVAYLDPTAAVTAEELDRAEALAGVTVRPGDALFVRTGLMRYKASLDGPMDYSVRAGLVASAVQWMHDRDIAVYSGDCIEKAPYRSARFIAPFHQIAICAMGLALLDWSDVETLAEACGAAGTCEFLLTVAPLAIPGGTGCAVNPVATF